MCTRTQATPPRWEITNGPGLVLVCFEPSRGYSTLPRFFMATDIEQSPKRKNPRTRKVKSLLCCILTPPCRALRPIAWSQRWSETSRRTRDFRKDLLALGKNRTDQRMSRVGPVAQAKELQLLASGRDATTPGGASKAQSLSAYAEDHGFTQG